MENKGKVMNIPNMITMFRILLVPVFCVLATNHDIHIQTIALIVFIAAAASDFFDGYYARKFKQVTSLGKLLDPLADKLLVITALISICAWNVDGAPRIPEWSVVVILGREFLITGLRSILAEKGHVLPASKWGKAKTVSQICAIILFLAYFDKFAIWVYYVALAITVISGLDYIFKTWKYVIDKK